MLLKYHRFLFLTCCISLLFIVSGCSSNNLQGSTDITLKTERFGHAAVNDGRLIYVIAGSNSSGFLSDIEVFDPKTGVIEVLDNKVIPRRYFSAVFDGKQSIYIIGGISLVDKKAAYEKRVEVFDTVTRTVRLVSNLPAPTRINTAVMVEKDILVFGGAHPAKGKLVASDLVAKYNVESNSWQRLENMPSRKTTRAVAKSNKVYLAGGFNRKQALNEFQRFDPNSGSWQKMPPLPKKVSAHSAVIANEKLHLFGDYKELDSVLTYDFSSRKWTEANIDYLKSRHNAATALDGIVYVIGGTQGTSGPVLNYIQSFKL